MAATDFLNKGGIPHWEADPSEWDRLVIGPYVMPGVWDISFECKRQIDVKKAKGKDGASFKDEGYNPPIIDLTGKIATAAQWSELQQVVPMLHPKVKGKERETFEIQHPKARLLSLAKVYITQIKAPSLSKGILTLVIQAIEYTPVPKAVKASVKPPVVFGVNLDAVVGVPESLKPP